MITVAVDLHIHSCLSPCGAFDMTPNNIVGMSKIKKLDVISVCDHNHTGNLEAISKISNEMGILLIPGLELETSEEIHLLCYFPSMENIRQMQAILNRYYRDIKIKEDIFGSQCIMDAEDRLVRKVEHLLATATTLDLYTAVSMVRKFGGVPVPAHVDRQSYSIISNLGSIPDDLKFNTVELSRYASKDNFLKKYPEYHEKRFLTSSDAHDLGMIFEREFFIELKELSISHVLEYLRS